MNRTSSNDLNIIFIAKNLSSLKETGLFRQLKIFITRDEPNRLLTVLRRFEKLRDERVRLFSALSSSQQKALFKHYGAVMHAGISLTMYNQVVSLDERLPEVLIVIDDLNDMLKNNDESNYILERLVKLGRNAGIRVLATSSCVEVDNDVYRIIVVNMGSRIIFKLSSEREADILHVSNENYSKLKNATNGSFLYNGQMLRNKESEIVNDSYKS